MNVRKKRANRVVRGEVHGNVVFKAHSKAVEPPVDHGAGLHKGGRVYVSQDEWKGKGGQLRHGLKVAAFRVELLNQIGRNRPRKEKGRAGASAPANANSTPQRPMDLNDEVPF